MPLRVGRFIVAALICATVTGASGPSAAAGEVLDVARSGYQALPSLFWQELHKAQEDGDKVIVVFTADWCSPCKTLKGLLEESAVVQRSVRDVRLLFIDVDAWRGPAHRLIRGAMPRSLPMLARVDERGELVQLAMGTEMGLLSEEATAGNFRRLAFGTKPERAAYFDDRDAKMALAREQARRRKARHKGLVPLEVEVLERARLDSGDIRWTLRVLVRNLDSRRRWFLLPGRLGPAQAKRFQATGRETLHFTDHVRATMLHLTGEHDLYALPLAAGSDAELVGWSVDGGPDALSFDVIELDRLTLDGEKMQFDKKVPYELRIPNAGATRVVASSDAPCAVELMSKQVLSVSLAAP